MKGLVDVYYKNPANILNYDNMSDEKWQLIDLQVSANYHFSIINC